MKHPLFYPLDHPKFHLQGQRQRSDTVDAPEGVAPTLRVPKRHPERVEKV